MWTGMFWTLLPLVLCAGSILGAIPIDRIRNPGHYPGRIVPNRYIIEIDEISSLRTIGRRHYARSLDAVYASIQERAIPLEINQEFEEAGIFVGASVTINSAEDVVAISNTPGIKSIRPVTQIDAPTPVKVQVVSGPNDAAVPPDTLSTHVLTGVDRLHAQGIYGKGIRIAIIDTGIDYTHPTLGGGIGRGKTIIGGWDFVGNNYTGENKPHPDPDPIDQCNGHGTHVAGIIAASPGNAFNISGVAYESEILAYKVFGCGGQVTDEVLVQSLIRGVREKADILTLSIGGPDGWTASTAAVVASRIARSGKIVTIAAGNSGTAGGWYTSNPGGGIDVISVGSTDNTVIPLQNLTLSGTSHPPITYFSTFPLPFNQTLPLYVIQPDITKIDDACEPLPDDTPDLSGYVTLVRRGTCTFVQKLTNIAEKGGNVTLIYDNGTGFTGIDTGNFTMARLIQRKDGEDLVKEYFGGNTNITVSFPQSGASTGFPDEKGGLMSSFSSYGPTNDFYFKPAVSAPGGNIISTFPVQMGQYAVLSGTSMATPFLAGASALLLQKRGKTKAVALAARDIFESTAQYISSSHTDGDPLQTVTQQGAGLVNVFDAIYSTTSVSPAELILNDTAHFKSRQTFTVKNTGTESKQYKLEHIPAGTALTTQPGSIQAEIGPVPLTGSKASVILTPSTFTLGAGQSQRITAVFSLPSDEDPSTYPVYSGFIQVTGPSALDTVHASYIGLKGTLKNKQVLDNTDYFFNETLPGFADPEGEYGDFVRGPRNYTFVKDDVPTLVWRFSFGSPAFYVDLVEPDIKYTPTYPLPPADNATHIVDPDGLEERGIIPKFPFPWFTIPHPNIGGSFGRVKIIGHLAEWHWISRNNEADNGFNTLTWENATFINDKPIRNGDYRFLVRALRVNGDPKNDKDYESWLSSIIGIRKPRPGTIPPETTTTTTTTTTEVIPDPTVSPTSDPTPTPTPDPTPTPTPSP